MEKQIDYVISEELGNAVLNYLNGRPYGEVADLVAALRQIQPVPDKCCGDCKEDEKLDKPTS